MSDKLYWVWVQNALGISASVKSYEIVSYFGNAEKLYFAGAYEWKISGIFTNGQINKLKSTSLDGAKQIVAECEKSGVHTKFIPDYGNIIPTKPYTEDLLGLPVINIRYVPLSNTFNALVKRCMDIVGSLICIVIFSPVMLLTAIAVKVTSKGPLIFKQERVGLHNEPFRMYKFRTMYVQTEEEERKGWTHKDDPRITKIGRFLRKTSLDEFPQLFNVLKGDMALIGPRPLLVKYLPLYSTEQMRRHEVRPGISGWAQCHGRNQISWTEKFKLDVWYVDHISLLTDLKVIFLTIKKVIFREDINSDNDITMEDFDGTN